MLCVHIEKIPAKGQAEVSATIPAAMGFDSAFVKPDVKDQTWEKASGC